MFRIGVVILNYQTWELSLRCMKSVQNACGRYPYKIYLVDNASRRPMPLEIRKFLAKQNAQVSFLQAAENRGYACGNNIGIQKALDDGCSMVVISNNDIVFHKNAVKNMAVCMRKHRKAGIVGPMVLDENGNVQATRCSMKTTMKEIFQIYTVARIIFNRKWKAYYCLDQSTEKPAYAYHVSGCCFAVSRECAEAIMPLDEGTVLYYEEQIVGMRMEQSGYRTVYDPESVVVHRHGATTQKSRPFMYQCISQSELYYCSKYLKAKKQQLWVLYYYRRWLYQLRCIWYPQLRKYRRTYMQETSKAYRQALCRN